MSSCFLNEVEQNLNEENDINSHLNLYKGLLMWFDCLANFPIFITGHIDLFEGKDEWCHEQGVDDQQSNHEVPNLAEGSLGVDQVPLKLGLTIDNLVFLVGVLINVVDHHLFQI